MKRWICLLLLAALLIGCTATGAPVVEQDPRVTDAPESPIS